MPWILWDSPVEESGAGSGLPRERFGWLSVPSLSRDSAERQRARVARGRGPTSWVPRVTGSTELSDEGVRTVFRFSGFAPSRSLELD